MVTPNQKTVAAKAQSVDRAMVDQYSAGFKSNLPKKTKGSMLREPKVKNKLKHLKHSSPYTTGGAQQSLFKHKHRSPAAEAPVPGLQDLSMFADQA